MIEENFCLSGEEIKPPYHYRSCGLDDIYLINGYLIENIDGEEFVTISNIDELHIVIGRHLISHRKALSPREIKFLRNTMGLTQAELADKLGNTSQSVARWEKGECEMPGASEKLLRAVFLASLLTKDELTALKELLMSKLTELDRMDELTGPPAQFELFNGWRPKAA